MFRSLHGRDVLYTLTMNKIQIKFTITDGDSQTGLAKISRYLGLKKMLFYDCYIASYDTNIAVFKFSNNDIKNNVLNIPTLKKDLKEINVQLPSLESTDGQPRQPYNPEHCTVFIRNLNPVYFYCFTRAEGGDKDETQQDKLNELITNIKNCSSVENKDFISHHFNQDLVDGKSMDPRTMTITFSNKAIADKFIKEDTVLEFGTIRSAHKEFHTEVKVPQCAVCKKTCHRKNSPACDKQVRCPRCLSTDHTKPINCTPKCWTHGPTGHSTGSNRCPLNRKYKKNIREKLKKKVRDEEELATLPKEHRKIHEDLKEIKEQLTWAGVTKPASQKNGAQTPQASTPNPPIQAQSIPPGIDILNVAHTYIFALINECLIPGKFKTTMDKYANQNGWPKLNHPEPDPDILTKIAPTAASMTEFVKHKLPELQKDLASETDSTEEEDNQIEENDSQEWPKLTMPSPVVTRSQPNKKLENPKFAKKVIELTKLYPPMLTPVKPPLLIAKNYVQNMINEKKGMIKDISDMIKENWFSLTPTKHLAGKESHITSSMLHTLAEHQKFRELEIHFKVP